jgi:hypothetical protein
MRAWEALPDLVAAYARSRMLPTQRQISRAIRRIGSDQASRAAKQALVDSVRRDLDEPERELLGTTLAYAEGLYRAARDDKGYEVPTREELRPLLPGLIGALAGHDLAHSLHAIRALALAGRSAPQAAPSLEPWLHDPRTMHEARRALRAIGTPEALEFVARLEDREALEKRIRQNYTIQDHQGRTRLLPFHVVGSGPDGVRMEARFLYDGRQPKRPERIVVAFESTGETARLEGVTQVEWLADATPVRMAGLDRSWSRSQSGIIERVSGTLPLRDFLTLAHARTLRARLGPVEFALEERDRAALRHFARKIPAATPPAVAE